MYGKENVWQKFFVVVVVVESTLLCYAIHYAVLCCAVMSMLLACQACKILSESVSVYFVRRYFFQTFHIWYTHILYVCMPRRSHSTQFTTHSLTLVWERGKKRKTIELVCYYLLTSWSIMIDVIERVEWIEKTTTTATTFLYLYNGKKNTFTKLMRSAHFTHFVWHVWWCTVYGMRRAHGIYKWANVKTFLTLYV